MWKILDEYPDYIIYSDGDVYSIKSKIIMSLSKTYDGYLRTVLTNKDGERKTVLIHTLVAKAFCENPLNKPFVGHLDDNPSNNNYTNLVWCTSIENNLYGSHRKVLLHEPHSVAMMDKEGNILKTFESMADAGRYLGNKSNSANISRACKNYKIGKSNYSAGYYWKSL